LAFVEYVEQNLVHRTELPEEKKKRLFRSSDRSRREDRRKYVAKRPAVCISDVECAQVLYLLMQDFLAPEKRTAAIAEQLSSFCLPNMGLFRFALNGR